MSASFFCDVGNKSYTVLLLQKPGVMHPAPGLSTFSAPLMQSVPQTYGSSYKPSQFGSVSLVRYSALDVVSAGWVAASVVGPGVVVVVTASDVDVVGPSVAVLVVVGMHEPHVDLHCSRIKSKWQKVFSKLCITPFSPNTTS